MLTRQARTVHVGGHLTVSRRLNTRLSLEALCAEEERGERNRERRYANFEFRNANCEFKFEIRNSQFEIKVLPRSSLLVPRSFFDTLSVNC